MSLIQLFFDKKSHKILYRREECRAVKRRAVEKKIVKVVRSRRERGEREEAARRLIIYELA